MTGPVASDSPTISPVILHTILFLFFFQLIADFVEAVYAFGLRGTSMPPEVVCIVLLLSPAALVLLPGLLSVWGLTVVGPLMLLSRVAYPALDTRGKMIVAGIGTACFLIYLPVRMVRFDNTKVRFHRWLLGWSLSLAVARRADLCHRLRRFHGGATLRRDCCARCDVFRHVLQSAQPLHGETLKPASIRERASIG